MRARYSGLAPRAGAWIETVCRRRHGPEAASLPARGRGLKQLAHLALALERALAPRAGAWIETALLLMGTGSHVLAPRAGAWIETCRRPYRSWPRHLAPRAGAWIETTVSPR